MTVQTRCKRCGRLFELDRDAMTKGRRPLCPDCRRPQPPPGGLPVSNFLNEWASMTEVTS